MWKSGKIRCSAIILFVSNIVLVILCSILFYVTRGNCGSGEIFPFAMILLTSLLRLIAMYGTAVSQRDTAVIIMTPRDTPVSDTFLRHEKRSRYKRWLRWTRFAMLITVMQFLGAIYLLFNVSIHIFQDKTPKTCILGLLSSNAKWKYNVLVIYIIMVCYVVLIQCFMGTDVLRWRSFYTNEDNAWKLHYREVFDHGIREALCCLGRVKYLTAPEEDEVYSVAQLLGDLVAYRASGAGHLELLTGLALLQRSGLLPDPLEQTIEAPEERILDAAAFHPFAEAAYTGLLLDLGRNPIMFLCAWLRRQGVLTPWMRKRLPLLKGDNWWRGHAAAFLKYVNLSPDVLRQGRVSQTRCEAAYFVVVLHDLKSVVVAVRGTETPEDLITDGLCRECKLTSEDLDGLISGNLIPPGSPHHGHSGIIEAARDLFTQIEGNPFIDGHLAGSGFLSSLMGAGCECDGYNLYIVGHSLGGSIAALLGVRLRRRYPNLHVYCYGPLPCVDFAVADACSDFVTSIVYHNEFSARLSVNSILRLQAAAMMALSDDADANSALIYKLARRFLFVSNFLQTKSDEKFPAPGSCSMANASENYLVNGAATGKYDHENSMWQDSSDDENDCRDSPHSFINPFADSLANNVNLCVDPVSQFMEVVPSSKNESPGHGSEMFLPGMIIHIIPEKRTVDIPLWRRWQWQDTEEFRAYVANREAFKDIVVSPSMFIDHLPWRCHYAMKKVLEMRNLEAIHGASQMV